MYAKVVILLCAAAVALTHEIEVSTPTVTPEPLITSYSTPASISNTYLPTSEVKIGSHYNDPSDHSVVSNYVPVHGHSLTQSAPIYTSAAPPYSTTPTSFQSKYIYDKSYPTVASYSKSTFAPSYKYSITSSPASHFGYYPSYSHTYAHPVVKSSYSKPLSYVHTAAVPSSYDFSSSLYTKYPAHSYVSYPSSTAVPSLSTSTLGYDSSSALAYSVSPTVASYSSPSSSYSIQAAPLKAQFSYAVSSDSYPDHEVTYGGKHLIHSVGTPYYGGHDGFQYISDPHYSLYSAHGWKK